MRGDDMDKWVEDALEREPLELDPNMLIELDEGEIGPPLTNGDIKAARADLAISRPSEEFRQTVQPLLKRCRSVDYFNRPNLKFLHDAFVLAEFVGHQHVDAVRMSSASEQWPDGYVRFGHKIQNVEVTSTHGGRKLGDEYKSTAKPKLIDDCDVRALSIPGFLNKAIVDKIVKRFSARAWLVVYLNISDFGIRQTQTEEAIKGIKERHAASFDDIFVLWKDKLL
jgi:hypothetical protein